jgi:hypothetical protein
MAARKLLCTDTFDLGGVGSIPWTHFLPADDAGVLSAKLLGRRIRVLIHVFEGLPVADQGMQSL